MADEYGAEKPGIVIDESRGGYPLRTPKAYAAHVRKLLADEQPRSRAEPLM